MLIVSQDRTQITDNLSLRIEVIVEEQGEFPNIQREPISYCVVDKKYSTQLGFYKTEERAKEVLQEIIFAYKCSQGKSYTIGDIEKSSGKYENAVYEMPEN